jgi:hypothetical protein
MLTIKRCLSFLCVGIILFSSCEKPTVPPHLQVIPADALFVVAIESEQLVKKGGLDNLQEYKFFQSIEKELSNQNPDLKEFVTKLIENPKASGIDTERFYVYGLNRASGFYAVATFKMNNLAAFEDNLAYLAKQNDIRIEDKGDYKLIAADNSGAFAWNDNVLLFMGGNLNGVDYKKSLSLSDNSIVSVADFRDFQKQTYDAALWMSYGTAMNILKEGMKMNIGTNIQMPSYLDELSSTYIHAYLHCDNGEIKITTECTPVSELDKFYAKYPLIKKDFNNQLLEDFPETTYMSAKFAINPLEYIKLLNTTYSSLNMYSIQEMLESPVVKTVVDGLGGDFLFNLYGFAQGPLPLPLAGISFSVKSEDDFNRILALIPERLVQPTGDFYAIGLMGVVTIYIAYKDNRVLVTDDAETITAFVGKGYSKSLKDGPLATRLKNEPALCYINLDLSSYPGNIRTLLQKEAKPVVSFLEICKDFSVGCDKDNYYNSYISLKFKDNKQNGLKLLIKSLDEIAAQ